MYGNLLICTQCYMASTRPPHCICAIAISRRGSIVPLFPDLTDTLPLHQPLIASAGKWMDGLQTKQTNRIKRPCRRRLVIDVPGKQIRASPPNPLAKRRSRNFGCSPSRIHDRKAENTSIQSGPRDHNPLLAPQNPCLPLSPGRQPHGSSASIGLF